MTDLWQDHDFALPASHPSTFEAECHQLRKELDRVKAERDALRERVDKLEEALEPFDDALGEDDEYSDLEPIRMKWGRSTYYGLKLFDLRTARDALTTSHSAPSDNSDPDHQTDTNSPQAGGVGGQDVTHGGRKHGS